VSRKRRRGRRRRRRRSMNPRLPWSYLAK